jgi:hypothetical protein
VKREEKCEKILKKVGIGERKEEKSKILEVEKEIGEYEKGTKSTKKVK